jgi:hypothetical protein
LHGELSTHRDLRRAGRAGLAAWIGFIVGSLRCSSDVGVAQRRGRSIGTTVGDVPAWIVPIISKPCSLRLVVFRQTLRWRPSS